MVIKTEYNKIVSYTTKDGALIRELMHPDIHGNSKQSLAEAIIPPPLSPPAGGGQAHQGGEFERRR